MSEGGRGGQVLKVTNLNDEGSGSFRQAIEAEGPRIVVFEVSGTIELQSSLRISNSHITIAGQTAPGEGICLKNYGLRISADHVIVRYLRVRPGDNEGQELDSVSVSGGQNIIVDHCSASWSVDETLSVASSNPEPNNVTIQWCIISESLNCSVHPKGCHGYGSLIRGGWGSGYTFHHNLYAHHRGRNPRPGNYNNYSIDPNGLFFDFRNNVVFNWGGSHAGYNADSDSITRMNFIGNYYKQGPDSTGNEAFREQCRFNSAFFQDNWMNGSMPGDPWSLVIFSGFTSTEIEAYKLPEPLIVPEVQTSDALTAYELVLADAGASFPIRDEVDARIINDVIDGTGGIIDDEAQVGGWPVLNSTDPPADIDGDGMPDEWEIANCLSPYNPDDAAADRDGDGYTNIEEYINWLPLNNSLPPETDLNCDSTVNFLDFSDFALHYLQTYRHQWYYDKYDLNNDREFSLADLSLIARDWLSVF